MRLEIAFFKSSQRQLSLTISSLSNSWSRAKPPAVRAGGMKPFHQGRKGGSSMSCFKNPDLHPISGRLPRSPPYLASTALAGGAQAENVLNGETEFD